MQVDRVGWVDILGHYCLYDPVFSVIGIAAANINYLLSPAIFALWFVVVDGAVGLRQWQGWNGKRFFIADIALFWFYQF